VEIRADHPRHVTEADVNWAENEVRALIQSTAANDAGHRGELACWTLRILNDFAGEDSGRSTSEFFPRFFYKLNYWEELRGRFCGELRRQFSRVVDEAVTTVNIEDVSLRNKFEGRIGQADRELLPRASKTSATNTARPLNYKSELKRSVLVGLTKNADATDLELCRWLDDDGAGELPSSWRSKTNDRSFESAYYDPKHRSKIQVLFSKIRRDMRDKGLLKERVRR
jgi:hypothetical protein